MFDWVRCSSPQFNPLLILILSQEHTHQHTHTSSTCLILVTLAKQWWVTECVCACVCSCLPACVCVWSTSSPVSSGPREQVYGCWGQWTLVATTNPVSQTPTGLLLHDPLCQEFICVFLRRICELDFFSIPSAKGLEYYKHSLDKCTRNKCKITLCGC